MSFARADSCPSHSVRLKLSTIVFMYWRGDCRKLTLSPRTIRSRSRWRIFSRSIATVFIRWLKLSFASKGIASVSTVAPAATAARTMTRNRGSCSFSSRKPIMMMNSKVEVDHFAHDEETNRHPCRRGHEHEATELLRPKQTDVIGTRQVDDEHDENRQRTDYGRRGLCLHRHRRDLCLHLFAIA